MKMFVLCLVIILTATLVSLANSENIPSMEVQGIQHGQLPIFDRGQVFYKGHGNTIHIDFKAIEDKLVKVQVEKEGVIILTDAVNDLSSNVIYEINLEKYGTGEYLISLTTAYQKKITETFKVQ